ncbi:MAG TPA: hypothetical protein P5080_02225 [Candidatus Paceibacterota bacterium]|nr:hypothetical protein [Candidatus Pacearchaeota archaeon]HRZ50786.1 hypothetical protein [Candidatus Paceibacterota bacterium]HSA36507.1 hypothetical protein [Candidatus Paceibacterota bacterium]
MLAKKFWVTRSEAHQIMDDNIVNIYHAERELGQVFADQRKKGWFEFIPFSEELLRRTRNTYILVPDFGLSIIMMRGLKPDLFQPNQYGNFTWSCDEPYLHETAIPAWRLIRAKPLFTSKKINWRHDLQSQLKLFSQYRYVPAAREIVNLLFVAGRYSEHWENFGYRSIRTASNSHTIGIHTAPETRINCHGEEYEMDVINIRFVHPGADVDDGIASAYKPLPSPQP